MNQNIAKLRHTRKKCHTTKIQTFVYYIAVFHNCFTHIRVRNSIENYIFNHAYLTKL